METAVRAPFAGRVREVLAAVNAQVDAGAALLRLDRAGDEAETVVGERVALPGAGAAPTGAGPRPRRCDAARGDAGADHRLRRQRRARPAARRRVRHRPRRAARRTTPELLHGELALLTTFADLSELSRNRPTSEEEEADEQVHSPREYFHAYLHSLDIEREGLPESFRARLSRALLHYGVERPRAAARRSRRRCTASSWPSSARPTSCPSSSRCSTAG